MARSIRYDFLLNGKGYLLSRSPDSQGRAWVRQSTPDTPITVTKRDEEQGKYGGVDPQIDYPEVWNDWSGGYGYAYRDPDRPNTYHWSENFDARFPRQLIHCQQPYVLANSVYTSDTGVSITGYPDVLESVDEIIDGSILATTYGLTMPNHLILAGVYGITGLKALNEGSTNFKAVSPWLPDINGVAGWCHPSAIYGSQVWVGRTQSGSGFSGFGLTGSTVASIYGYRFAVAGNQLWRAHGNSRERAYYAANCGNPNGVASPTNWGATYNIGNYRSPILDMIAVDDQVFLGTPDGLYAGDQTGTFINVLSQLGRQYHPDNCRDLAIFEGKVVAPHVAGVFSYHPGTGIVEDISPPRADRSPVIGRVRTVRGHGRWLYSGLWTGSTSWLLAADRQSRGLVWHTLQRLPAMFFAGTKISRLYVDGLGLTHSLNSIPNNFWICTEGSPLGGGGGPSSPPRAHVFFWPIPPLDGNPLANAITFSANYIGSARMDLGSTDSNAPGTYKIYRAVEVEAEQLASGYVWADIYYTVDSGSRTQLGSVRSSPKTTLYFPTNVTGQSIELSVESFTSTRAITPVYRSIVLRGALMPTYTDEITAMVRVADNIADREGQPMRPGATMMRELRELGNPAISGAQNIELIDPLGISWRVKLLGPPEEREAFMGDDDNTPPEIAATVRMAVLTFTTPYAG